MASLPVSFYQGFYNVVHVKNFSSYRMSVLLTLQLDQGFQSLVLGLTT